MKNKTKHPIIIGLMILFGVIGQTVFTSTAAASPTIVPNPTYGATYGEFSARWWQWLLSIPAAVNPNLDTTGEHCGLGQYDDVWFLAGTFGGPPVTRTCTIPAGKPIFFPIINSLAFKPTGKDTLNSLRGIAAVFPNTVTALTVTVDGDSVDVLSNNYRARSPSFTIIAPPKGIITPGALQSPGNTDTLVSDGYWVLLPPLAATNTTPHTIQIYGTTNATSGNFVVDVTYKLYVTP